MDPKVLHLNQPEYLLKMKAAINGYYMSIQRSGVYDMEDSGALPWVSWEPCIVIHGDVAALNNKNGSVYICDIAAFGRLQSALLKVSPVDGGITWPCVTVCSDHLAVDWFLLRGEVEAPPHFSQVPNPKKWFIVDKKIKHLFEYTMSLLHLVTVQTTATLVCQHKLMSNESIASTIEQNVVLNMIIIHPGDVIVSLPLPYERNRLAGASVQHALQELQTYTACIIQKSQSWLIHEDCLNMSNTPAENSDTHLEYHIVTDHIPDYVQSLVSHSNQCSIARSSVACEINLGSEITIKDEPLFMEDKVQCDNSCEVRSPPSHSDVIKETSHIPSKEIEQYKNASSKSSVCTAPHKPKQKKVKGFTARTLYCPKCNRSFKENKILRLKKHIKIKHCDEAEHLTRVVDSKYDPWKPKTDAGFYCTVCGCFLRGSVTHVHIHHLKKHPHLPFQGGSKK